MFYTTTVGFRSLCRLILFCFTFATFHPANLHVPWTLYFAQWTFDFGPAPAYGKAQDPLRVATPDTMSTKAAEPGQNGPSIKMVRLPGHVLPALAKATYIEVKSPSLAEQPLTLTLVLKRDDQPGFDKYLRDVYDPKSPNYRKFLTQSELSDRFGPSQEAYDDVLSYLQISGFTLVEGSANRMTLTVRGTRTQVEHTFDVGMGEYRIGEKTFYANDRDPALPTQLASSVQAVVGLSNRAEVQGAGLGFAVGVLLLVAFLVYALLEILKLFGVDVVKSIQESIQKYFENLMSEYTPPPIIPIGNPGLRVALPIAASATLPVTANATSCGPWAGTDGTGQTIGLVEFDTFQTSDVADFLALSGAPASRLSQITQVHVNGGATPGPNQDEVLLDIDTILTIAPGANIVVYDAPFGSAGNSYQPILNKMINDGVTIISNSWSFCEDQATQADVDSIDAIFKTAAASGISIFNAAGDSGTTCLDGAPNTIGVPANSPNATAVGGTSLTSGPGFTYGGETWWNGINSVPPSGQGGFGESKFFTRPSYQDGFNTSPMRSIPDVSINADPGHGILICQASAGGCPTGLLYGGTSAAAPIWAAFTALLNQAQGQNLGFLNPLLYPLANTNGFHNPASMGTDFAHVGLGSPHLANLHLLLCGETVGLPDADDSQVLAVAPASILLSGGVGVPADGTTAGSVVVKLFDANGIPVSGKTVSLTATPSSDVTITPASGVTSVEDGTVTFTVTNLTTEDVTFIATDTTDGITLSQQATVPFVTPPATSAGITASPTPVTANGIATTTITVTLKDALNRPTPGKLITLSQGNGHSIITGPNPSVTDSNGQIQFTATNLVNETVTYTAVDVTDGDLPVPGSAVVTFTNSTNLCGSGAPTPVGQNGYVVTPFATGFVARPLSFGGINFGGCPGASTPAFLDSDIFFSDWTGDVIKLPATGGAVTSANRLANVGQTLAWPVVSKGGKLYAARASTGSGFSGVVVEINPTTGAVVRTLASGLRCPFSLAIDPLSGDLFFDGGCSGAGFDDPNIYRIRNPDSATPTLEVYATLPATPNGKMSFAPDGTLYVVTGYFSATPTISRVSGTNVPGAPTITTVPGVNSFFWVNVAETATSGAAKSLLTLSSQGLELVDITVNPPTKTLLANNLGGGEIGPDGCLYSPIENVVYRLTDPTGGCGFASASVSPSLRLTPAAVSPNPSQGTTQTFTATFHNIDVPADTPVFFTVLGANPRFQLVRTNASGQATLSYTAFSPGKDTIVATATTNSSDLTSNKAQVTWATGKHVTFLTLNPSPKAGSPSQPVTVIASLTDLSVIPPVPVIGVAVIFTLGSAQCVGTTNGNGIASCTLVPSVVGMGTLTATFAGSDQFVESTDSVGFNVLAEPPPPCEPSAEVCDGQDNDCDGQTDEGLGTLSCGVGACARTVNVCQNGTPQTCTPGAPTTEVCDGQDNNCEGTVDEGNPGGGASCNTGIPGVCSAGTLACTSGALVCQQTTQSSAEVCDGRDNDCDGQTDEGLGTLSCGVGACAQTVNACENGVPQTCTPGSPSAEVCGDGQDNDCDGQTDEGCQPPPTTRCPLSQGYWKNHRAAWPVTALQLGAQTYSQAELLSLLRNTSTSDASLILARQLIAAKLNIVNGSDPNPASATITDADQRLGAFAGKLPYKVKMSSAAGKAMVAAAGKLESYNSGKLTPQCQK